MNMILLIIRVHATKITQEISDTFTLSEDILKCITKSIDDEFTVSDYVVADGDIIELKYPI